MSATAATFTATPGIDIQKTTNGPTNTNPIAPDYDNEDSPNGPGVPVLTAGSSVTWTYQVTNTVEIGPGESRDVIFTAPAPGTYLLYDRDYPALTNAGGGGRGGQMTEIRVSAPGMDIYELRVRIDKHATQELTIHLSVAT